MIKRFKQMLIDNCENPMAEQKGYYQEQFNEWMGAREQVDDILVMGFNVNSNGQ